MSNFKKNLKEGKNPVLKSAILALALIILSAFAVSISGCRPSLERYEQNLEKIGTSVDIVIYADKDSNYQKILDSGFAKIDEISKIASNSDPESPVAKLNTNGFIENAPKDLIEMIKLSKDYNKITIGVFDITINPILALWSGGLQDESSQVQKQKILEALNLVSSDKITISGSTIKFEKEGMSVTLGGIMKGYIVDRIIETLKSQGVRNAFVNLGGHITALGKKPDGGLWNTSLENSDNTEKIVEFALAGKSIVTSGNYYRYFDSKEKPSSSIDPRTGFIADKSISATVIAGNATIADILATTVYILGPEDGIKLVNSLDNVEALIIDTERNIIKSKGMDKYILK